MSSDDFDGPPYRPGSGRGADEQRAGAPGVSGNRSSYPEPEGWSSDGVWRDPAVDSNYETNVQNAVRPSSPQPDTGYSYWSDGQGWQRKPGTGAGSSSSSPAWNATSSNPARTAYGAGPASGLGAPGSEATAAYHGAPGFPPPSGGYGGAGGYGAGGYGAGGAGRQGWAGGFGGPAVPGRPGGPGGPRRPPGPRGSGRGDWWRKWTWKKAAAVAGGMFAFFCIVMFGGYEYMSSTAVIPAAATSATVQNTTVYYSDGKTVLGTIGETNRQDLAYNQIPMMLQDAVVSAEDKNFWTEGGVSPTGILRAAIHDVLSGGSDLNGGSTITQEFVRNYYDGVGTEQTASRKIKEIFIAQKVAATYSKQWIMQHYLNTIYMGDGANGMEAAAETYFGVSVPQLTTAQDAVLAGMIQSPSEFYLPANRQDLISRWHYVLGQMVKNGYLTQAQANAQKFPVLVSDKTSGASSAGVNANSSDPWAPYILTQVDQELIDDDGFTQQQLSTGGYKIVTTISRSMEVQLYKAVNENLSGKSISSTSGATVTSLPPWVLVGAQLQDPKTGQILAEYPGKGQDVSTAECDGACQLNTATQTREQVGSSFKPYVLSTAVSQGMNVLSSQLNTSPYLCVAPNAQQFSVPLTLAQYTADTMNKSDCSKTVAEGFPVENDGGEIIGKQVGQTTKGAGKGAKYYSDNTQGALAASSNTGFTDLAHRVGTQNVVNMAKDFGVNTANAPGGSNLQHDVGEVGIALGIDDLTVQEQTQMVATLDDNGMYHQAHLVKYWLNPGVGSAQQVPRVQAHQVLTPQQAGDVQYAMEATTLPGGTAYPSVTYGNFTPGVVIGKTGTTTDSKSGFFVGATQQYALVVGMFVNDPNSKANANNSLENLGGGGFGGYWPAKIWNSFAEAEFSPQPQLFSTTPDVQGMQAWNLVGQVPNANCFQQQNGHGGHNNPQSGGQNINNCLTGNGNNNPNNQNNQNNPFQTGAANNNGGGGGGGGGFGGGGFGAGGTAGGIVALPGSLLLTEVPRRRRRKNRRRKAE